MTDETQPPGPATVLLGATLVDGSTADVRLEAGVIAAIGPAGSIASSPGDSSVPLDGHVLLPAAVEPHAHLDKAFLADVVTNEAGDLPGAIAAMVKARSRLGVGDMIERAQRAARLMAANGYRVVRTHADVTTDNGLTSMSALTEVRSRVADVIDVQIVALVGSPVTGLAGVGHRSLLAEALAAGADLVGGCPHLEGLVSTDRSDAHAVRAATELLLDVAASTGCGVDLHTDETLDPTVNGLVDLAEIVITTGFAHPVTASHCVSLSMRPAGDQRRIAEAVAEAGIAIVALPATNLFLQGRDQQQAMPRGVTAVKALRAAGVTVAAGADNLQDPFNPVGRACPFETASWMMLTTHVLPHQAWSMVSSAAGLATGTGGNGIEPGAPADLIAVAGASLREAIAFGPPERIVWRAGQRQHHV